jgi:hypothetical protein
MNMKRKIKLPECLCGCGGRTKGGRFLPGHDAKLKKALVADVRAGKKRARNKLEKLGWSKFLEKARAKRNPARMPCDSSRASVAGGQGAYVVEPAY